jgi:PAS domain S-box-containing protein
MNDITPIAPLAPTESVAPAFARRAPVSSPGASRGATPGRSALLQAGDLQNAIFNSPHFSSIATDAKGVIQIFNVGAERMLGYTACDVINRITPADISDPQELVARAKTLSVELKTSIAPGFEALVFKASRGIEDIYELTYIRKDGSRFPAVVSVSVLRDAESRIIGYLLVGTDNTARKRAEEALQKVSTLQSAIFNSANFSSIATDANGVIQIFNVGAERMLGYAAGEVVNRITPADISDPQEVVSRAKALSAELGTPIAPGFEALVFKASRGIEDIYQLTYIRKDGSRFAAVVSVTALRDDCGGIIGYLLIGTDNTARQQVEEERSRLDQRLRDQHFYTRALFESNIDALITTDPRGIITDLNKQMEALTGCTRDELIGSPFKNHFTDRERAEASIRLVLDEGKVTNYELTACDREGKETVVSYNATTFHDRDRRLQGVFAAVRDVTENRQYEQSLREARHKAEDASRAKSEFLANMSHEIRTPMNAVIGLTSLLGKTALDEHQMGLLDRAKLASKSLLMVLNNVLDLSKIEAGELIVEHAPFQLRTLLKEIDEVMSVEAEAKGISFRIDAPADLPDALEGDPTRLHQILTNLLSNAIKFTERGSVVVSVRAQGASAGSVTLGFIVCDTGIGMAPADQLHMFAPFAQADASITRRFGGTGLGLSIVKRLVNLMGGTVMLQSTPGKGSTFTVVLDFAPASPEALESLRVLPPTEGDQGLSGIRILVVDDSDTNLDVTQSILELEGAQVVLAKNGEQACDVLRAAPLDIDLVLMDIQMPILDGYDATRRIRLELGLADLPIIALTAGALSSERQRAEAAGMNDYLIKPFDPGTLVRRILRHLQPSRRARTDPAGVAAPPVEGPRRVPGPGSSLPWPAIEGMESSQTERRLGGDTSLLARALERLLDEFGTPLLPGHACTPAHQAAHMHKLKGCAGTLGAQQIERLAGAAEAAYAGGELARAGELSEELAICLQDLKAAGAAFLCDARAHAQAALNAGGVPTGSVSGSASDSASESATFDPPVLARLIELLAQQSIAATEHFEELLPGLRRLLGDEALARVRGQIAGMRFGDALLELTANPAFVAALKARRHVDLKT